MITFMIIINYFEIRNLFEINASKKNLNTSKKIILKFRVSFDVIRFML